MARASVRLEFPCPVKREATHRYPSVRCHEGRWIYRSEEKGEIWTRVKGKTKKRWGPMTVAF